MKATPILSALGAVFMLCACDAKSPSARTTVDTAKIFEAIKTDEVHWNSDWKAGDASLLTRHYAPTATVISPGAAPMTGVAAIKAGLQRALGDKSFSMSFSSDKVDIAASGDIAVARGAYTQTQTNPQTQEIITQKGNFVAVYKPQEDGAWKAVWVISAPGETVSPAKDAQ